MSKSVKICPNPDCRAVNNAEWVHCIACGTKFPEDTEITEPVGDVIKPVIENPLPFVPLEEEEGMPVIQLMDDSPAIAKKDLGLITGEAYEESDSYEDEESEEEYEEEEYDEEEEEEGGLPRGLILILGVTAVLAVLVGAMIITQVFGLFRSRPSAPAEVVEESKTQEEESIADPVSENLWDEEAKNIDRYYRITAKDLSALNKSVDTSIQNYRVNGATMTINQVDAYYNSNGQVVIAVMYGALNGRYITGYAAYEDEKPILVVAEQDIDQYRFYLKEERLFRYVDEYGQVMDFREFTDPGEISEKGIMVFAAQNVELEEGTVGAAEETEIPEETKPAQETPTQPETTTAVETTKAPETTKASETKKAQETGDVLARDYILPDADSRNYNMSELKEMKLTKEQLRYARNEIYARHGWIFSDPKLDAHFRSKSWYVPKYTKDEFEAKGGDNLLNSYELANRTLIQSMENE